MIRVSMSVHRGAVTAPAVMMQSRESLRNDLPTLAEGEFGGGSALYLSVGDLDAAITALSNVEIVIPRRETEYGATEVFVRDGCGNLLGLAEHASPDGSDG